MQNTHSMQRNHSNGGAYPASNGYPARTSPEAEGNPIKWRGATFEGQSTPASSHDSQYTLKPDSPTMVTTPGPMRAQAARDVADFFNPEIFQIVLHNPTTSYQLLRFSQSRFCGENMEFLEKVDRFNTLLDEMTKTMSDIHRSYTSPQAPRQLNISSGIIKRMNADIKQTTQTTLPALELIFSDAQESTEKLLATDVYPRFVKHQLTSSAVKALSMDRSRYAGLGDCFCLTNPSAADNPIQFASDGFVSVTGYSRTDIIPRNCRFLQGNYTDRGAVGRIKTAIENSEESVELLLNYRKTGEPFWNLLYVTPLLGPDGKVAYFLGGQINCSTTIHNRSDVLRVLSISDEEEKPEPAHSITPNDQKEKRGGFLKAFRNKSFYKAPVDQEAGMEQNLIRSIEKMDFKNQVQTFYSAYSKFIVLSYPHLIIQFFSPSIVDIFSTDPTIDVPLANLDIFKVLSQYAINSGPSMKDIKLRVKATLKAGRAVSSEIGLSIRRSGMIRRGHEKFAMHWTPLKDEVGGVAWVVVTMASMHKI